MIRTDPPSAKSETVTNVQYLEHMGKRYIRYGSPDLMPRFSHLLDRIYEVDGAGVDYRATEYLFITLAFAERVLVHRNHTPSIWDRYERPVAEAFEQRHYMKASNLVKEALSKAYSYNSLEPQLLNTADDMADFHARQGEFETAASIYRLSIEVKKNALGEAHPDVERTIQAFMKALGDAGCLTPVDGKPSAAPEKNYQ